MAEKVLSRELTEMETADDDVVELLFACVELVLQAAAAIRQAAAGSAAIIPFRGLFVMFGTSRTTLGRPKLTRP
jgi:hypothetical protein